MFINRCRECKKWDIRDGCEYSENYNATVRQLQNFINDHCIRTWGSISCLCAYFDFNFDHDKGCYPTC